MKVSPKTKTVKNPLGRLRSPRTPGVPPKVPPGFACMAVNCACYQNGGHMFPSSASLELCAQTPAGPEKIPRAGRINFAVL
jgi:hypothetical protein